MSKWSQDVWLRLTPQYRVRGRTESLSGIAYTITKKKPALRGAELAVPLTLSIDPRLFARPAINAVLALDDRHVQRAEVEVAAAENTEAAA